MQFVAAREIANQPPEAIAQQLLEEIPRQVTEYMKAQNITPSTLRMLLVFFNKHMKTGTNPPSNTNSIIHTLQLYSFTAL